MKKVFASSLMLLLFLSYAVFAQNIYIEEEPIGEQHPVEGYIENEDGQVLNIRDVTVSFFVMFEVTTVWDNDPTIYRTWPSREYTAKTNQNGFFSRPIPADTQFVVTRFDPITGGDIDGIRTERFSNVVPNSWDVLELQLLYTYFYGFPRLVVNSPVANTNQIIIPLSYLNTHVTYGYKVLDLYIHQLLRSVNGYNYYLNCAQPTISLNSSNGNLNFMFNMSAKRNGINIGSGSATISVAPTMTDVNGKKMLSIVWNNNSLNLTGFSSQYITDLKSIIVSELPNNIHLAPAGVTATYSWDLPNNWHGSITNQTELESIQVNTSEVIINFNTGWFVGMAPNY